jgi:hypothetical protein
VSEVILQPGSETVLSVVQRREKLAEKYKPILNGHYAVLIQEGKISANSLKVLATILAGLDETDVSSYLTDLTCERSPEVVYAWAVSRSSLPFPALTLKEAEKGFKHSLGKTLELGFSPDKVIRIPITYANSGDSNSWSFIKEIVSSLYKDWTISDSTYDNNVVPELNNDTVLKLKTLGPVIERILELLKSPKSFTIRKGDVHDLALHVKNAVDFVIFDYIYSHRPEYHELGLAGYTLSEGRRIVSQQINLGGRVAIKKIFSGYKLSEYLRAHLSGDIDSQNLEDHPFISMILQILKDIAKSIGTSVLIPKAFFGTPSNQIRSEIRRGPDVKTKKGTKANLYTPFSFAKSAECAPMNEAIRREMIDLGSSILIELDKVNEYSCEKSAIYMPFFRNFLKAAYAASDECRKQWRNGCMVPNMANLISVYRDQFPSNLEEDRIRIEYLSKCHRTNVSIVFTPGSNDPSQLERIRAQVKEINNKKKGKRV